MKPKLVTPSSIAFAVVKELGGVAKVAAICDIRRPSVYDWFKRGIPNGQYKFLKLLHPELKSWKLESKLDRGQRPFSSRRRVP